MTQSLEASPLFDNVGAIVKARAVIPAEVHKPHLIVALDSSSSMSTCFDLAKQALRKFYEKADQAGSVASSTLYVFNRDTDKHELTAISLKQRGQLLDDLSANHGTNFHSVLSAILQQIDAGPRSACYFVVFFTGAARLN